jgi:hypothetical protein
MGPPIAAFVASMIALLLSLRVASAEDVVFADGSCLRRMSPGASQYEQNLKNGLRLVFRGEGRPLNKEIYYLVSRHNRHDSCGAKREMTVYAQLVLPPIKSNQWIGSFKCFDAKTLRHQQVIVVSEIYYGPYNPKRKTLPLKEWAIDFTTRSFKEIPSTVCDAAGE